MAQVSAELATRIDRYLDDLIAEWADIPVLGREWPRLSHPERRDFILEWSIKEDRMMQLQEYARQELLAPEQRSRFQGLLKLVAQHRPILEQLLAD